MHTYNNMEMGFFGMHMLWWIFWAIGLFTLFAIFEPVPRKAQRKQQTPLEILLQRYAAGDINDEEYESKKYRIERDLKTTILSSPINA
jgi:putative membrane protein